MDLPERMDTVRRATALYRQVLDINGGDVDDAVRAAVLFGVDAGRAATSREVVDDPGEHPTRRTKYELAQRRRAQDAEDRVTLLKLELERCHAQCRGAV